MALKTTFIYLAEDIVIGVSMTISTQKSTREAELKLKKSLDEVYALGHLNKEIVKNDVKNLVAQANLLTELMPIAKKADDRNMVPKRKE